MTVLSASDRVLLRRVVSWMRANGWTRDRSASMPAWHSRYQITSLNAIQLDLDADKAKADGGVMHVQRDGGWLDMWVTSVRETVDVLCALSVLPAEFSSQWQAGRDELVEDIFKNNIQLTVEEYYSSLKAEAGQPLSAKHKQGFLEGIEEATNGLCDVLGIAHPLWNDMRQMALDADEDAWIERCLAGFGAQGPVTPDA